MRERVTMEDDLEAIQKCLSCGYPECVNCLGGENYGRTERKYAKWREAVSRCAAEGMSDNQISAAVGIAYTTVKKIRLRFGIPSLYKGRRGRPRGSGKTV